MLPALPFAPPIPPLALAAAVLIVFGAGIVRGYSGFGFSALSLAGLTLLVSPAQVVPAIFVLEVLASLTLLRTALRDADVGWLSWLIAGNALCIPVGIALLAWLPETPLRLLVGALLLAAAMLMRSGRSLALAPTPRTRLGVGMVSGLVNGLAAIGGIAVAAMLSATALPAAAMRATMILLFLFTDLYALAWAGLVSIGETHGGDLLGTDTLRWALWLAPPMLLGIGWGGRLFVGVSPQVFRRQVLNLLIAVASISVLRAGLALIAAGPGNGA